MCKVQEDILKVRFFEELHAGLRLQGSCSTWPEAALRIQLGASILQEGFIQALLAGQTRV